MVAKDKGSLGNRVNCAGEQTVNNAACAAKSVATATAGIVGYNAANNLMKGKAFKWNSAINEFLREQAKNIDDSMNIFFKKSGKCIKDYKFTKKGVDIAVQKAGKFKGKLFTTIGNFALKSVKGFKNLLTKLAKTSGRQKALGAFALLALATLNYITNKHCYQAGQIDQKYTDRAKLEKNAV
jgi:hypothetical protein